MSDKVRTAYIAGPITGDPDYKKKFAAAEDDLIEKGFGVFNPVKIMEPLVNAGVERRIILTYCTLLARFVDVLAVLEGWEKSEGAKKELAAYLRAGDKPKEVRYYSLCESYERIEAGWRAHPSWAPDLSDMIDDEDEDEKEADSDENSSSDEAEPGDGDSSDEVETPF